MADHNAKQPEPLLTRGAIVTAISGLTALCVHFAPLQHASEWLDANRDWVATGVLFFGPSITAVLSRLHVTPIASPKDAAGNKLAVIEAPPAVTVEAADVLAAANAVHPMGEAA